MKNRLIAILLPLVLGAGSALAEEVKIGYVDIQAVINTSKVGQQAREELNKFIQSKKSGLESEEKKLKAMQEALEKDKLLLPQEQRVKKEQEFRAKMQQYQQMAAASQQELQKRQAESSRKMLGEIEKIVIDVAKKENFTMLVERNEAMVLFAKEGLDLTETVIKQYDAQYKK